MIIKLLVVFLTVYITSNAEESKYQDESLRKIQNNAFKVGEKLSFSIGWEFISAGTAVLNVESATTINDRPCYSISAVTNSNAFFSTLYKVRNRLETYVDMEGIYPLRYVKNTSEGGYKRNFVVDFHHDTGKASIADVDSGQTEVNVPVYVQDIISAFYYIRTQPLAIGNEITLSTFDNGKYRDVIVKVLRKERVSVTAGDFECIVVQTPIGPFKNRSDLNIWLTDDARKIPVLMKSKIAVGSIRAELESMEGV
ncbi:DUF3108 domain-containing protein [bacterium]|nr:DUF3108 domain-containing protein [bacterium]